MVRLCVDETLYSTILEVSFVETEALDLQPFEHIRGLWTGNMESSSRDLLSVCAGDSEVRSHSSVSIAISHVMGYNPSACVRLHHESRGAQQVLAYPGYLARGPNAFPWRICSGASLRKLVAQ